MTNLAMRPVIAGTLRGVGVDPRQYSLLMDLFSKLGDRQEFEAGNGRFSLRMIVGMFTLLSGFINLIVAFGPQPPVRSYIFGNFVFATFLLVMILTMEAVNTFLNPVEASVLAHHPIRDSSYFAAKLTHLAVVVGYVIFPISAVPALAGLNLKDAGWFYSVIYLVSAYLLGFFVALMGCGVLGLLFRILPAARIRNAGLWVQIGFFTLIGVGPRVLAAFRGVGGNVDISASPALPLNWFVTLAAAGPSAGIFLTILLMPLFVWYWGIDAAALFAAYSLAVGSFYLSFELFIINGLPFANPPEAMRGSMAAPLVIAALLGAVILVGLQWLFIFQSQLVTAGATLVFVGAAYVVAQHSLRYLEVNVLHNLHVISTGRTAMFTEVG